MDELTLDDLEDLSDTACPYCGRERNGEPCAPYCGAEEEVAITSGP